MFDKYIDTQNQARSERGTAIAENKGVIIINTQTSDGRLSFWQKVLSIFSSIISIVVKFFK